MADETRLVEVHLAIYGMTLRLGEPYSSPVGGKGRGNLTPKEFIPEGASIRVLHTDGSSRTFTPWGCYLNGVTCANCGEVHPAYDAEECLAKEEREKAERKGAKKKGAA